jgi:sec-independent protein translocase protein TatA
VQLSPGEILLILLVALLIFGPKRLPEIGKSLGKGIREFKGACRTSATTNPALPLLLRAPHRSRRGPLLRFPQPSRSLLLSRETRRPLS